MSAQTLPLFDQRTMSLEEQLSYMEALANRKCKDFSATLGYFKSRTLKRTHNALVVVLTKSDRAGQISIEGEDFPDMVKQIVDYLNRLT
jgi:hypothetical protein